MVDAKTLWSIVGVAVVLGVLSNFVGLNLEKNDEVLVSGRWKESPPAEVHAVDETKLRTFLGVSAAPVVETEDVASTTEPGVLGHFSYNGKSYRLSGLVIGSISAATILSEDGEAFRLEEGGQLPSGETIKSLSINEIVVSSGGTESAIKVYEW